MPLSITSTTTAASACTAVENSIPVIWKSPSPEKHTTGAVGKASLAAMAAGSP